MFTKSIIAVVFTLIVLGVSATLAQNSQKVTIKLGTSGYQPANFKLKKGVRTNLTFIRTTDRTCGQQIVLPAYGITRDLPLNEPVAVIFTPKKSGTFSFTCGMHMMRGKIIVN